MGDELLQHCVVAFVAVDFSLFYCAVACASVDSTMDLPASAWVTCFVVRLHPPVLS